MLKPKPTVKLDDAKTKTNSQTPEGALKYVTIHTKLGTRWEFSKLLSVVCKRPMSEEQNKTIPMKIRWICSYIVVTQHVLCYWKPSKEGISVQKPSNININKIANKSSEQLHYWFPCKRLNPYLFIHLIIILNLSSLFIIILGKCNFLFPLFHR